MTKKFIICCITNDTYANVFMIRQLTSDVDHRYGFKTQFDTLEEAESALNEYYQYTTSWRDCIILPLYQA